VPRVAATLYAVDHDSGNNRPGKSAAALLPQEEPSGTTGTQLGYLHRIIFSAISRGPSSEGQSQEVKERLENQSILAQAIWQLWYAGVLNEFDSRVTRGLSIPKLQVITVDLRLWLGLYPQGAGLETDCRFHLQLFPEHDGPNLTWEDYARYGRAIALPKKALTAEEARALESCFVRRLVTAMILAPAQDASLPRCFRNIFTSFSSALLDQHKDLENSCQRFRKQFAIKLSESEERRITGHSIRRKGAAILAAVFDRQARIWRTKSPSEFEDLEGFSIPGAKFSSKRALVWAARLILYYASPKLEMSPLPMALCSRALDGCTRVLKMIHSHPHQKLDGLGGHKDGEGVVPEGWQDINFAGLWAEWICFDSDFFLHDS
jgi:hypothetical protein